MASSFLLTIQSASSHSCFFPSSQRIFHILRSMTKCCQCRQHPEAFPLTWSWCRHQLWAAAWWCWRSPRRQPVKEECSLRHSGVQSLPPWPAATPPPSETSKCTWLHLHMYSAYVQCTGPSIFCLWVQVGMSTQPSGKDARTTQNGGTYQCM